MASSGPVPRDAAPDRLPLTTPLDEAVHALGAHLIRFEIAQHDAEPAALERSVLRCARDLRDLLVRVGVEAKGARTPAVRQLDAELVRGLRVAFGWIAERLDDFAAAATLAVRAPGSRAWFNVPSEVDRELTALMDLAAIAAADGGGTEALALTLKRLRGAMHRLALLTTTAL